MTRASIRHEPFEQAGRDQLFETYHQLRDEAPVYRTGSGYWVVSRYEDVRRVLLSPERFSSAAQQDEAFGLSTRMGADADPQEMAKLMAIVSAIPVDVGELLTSRIIIGADAPMHTRIRRIVVRGFSPKRIARYEAKVKEIIAERTAGIDTAAECASVLTTDPWTESDQVQPDVNTLARNAALLAYEKAGIGPRDLDLIELHDCFASAELLHYDNLGLCDPGAAGEFIDSGAPDRDGSSPVNVSGGLLSKGHPIGMTGVAGLFEVTTHLRGEAGDRQIPNAKVGLARVIGLGSVCGVHILEKRAWN